MKNIKLRDVEGYAEFKAECDFFRCEEEYPGWTGSERYIIISNLSEEELNAKYPLVLAAMRPFLIADDCSVFTVLLYILSLLIRTT